VGAAKDGSLIRGCVSPAKVAGGYRYEKAHAASNISSAIEAIKLVTRLDLRIRRLDSGALFFSSRLTGMPLIASTKRKSFTCRF
jgi:hypothetical protein